MYEMNGMNANQQNTTQTGPCQPGTGPNGLFSIVYSHSNGFKKTNSIIRAVCACLTQLTHTQAQPLVNTHKHTPSTSLQLFNHCHQCLSLFQLLSSLLRDSFERGHSRFCHTHSSANGLQRAPKN